MKQLTEKQQANREGLISELRTKASDISDAYQVLQAAHDELYNAVTAYNFVVAAAASLRDDLVTAMQEYYDERSDQWHESDAGSDYQSWIDAWEGSEFDEIETPDLPDEPDCPHADDLAELPDGPA